MSFDVHRLKIQKKKELFFFFDLDKAEPEEDPEVTRAKYFIRDEFLVEKPTVFYL